jgi:membrane protein
VLVAPSSFSLNGIPLKEVVKRTWAEVRTDDIFGRAAQLAYYFFLALFPFLIFVTATLSIFGTADRGRAVLFRVFARFLPPSAFQLISQTFNEILKASGPLKMSLGIVFSIVSASMGMSAVMDTLNAAYRVKESRSLVKQYAVAVGLTCSVALLLILSLLMAVIGDEILAELPEAHIFFLAWRAAQWPLSFALLLFAFALTYNLAPDLKDRKWQWITPGAIFGTSLLLAVSGGVRVYAHFVSNYTATYGSLGAVIILLLCFYLSGVAVLSGGVLNGVLEGGAPGIEKAIGSGSAAEIIPPA